MLMHVCLGPASCTTTETLTRLSGRRPKVTTMQHRCVKRCVMRLAE